MGIPVWMKPVCGGDGGLPDYRITGNSGKAGSAGNSGIPAFRNYGITGLRDYGITGLRDYGITELRHYGITAFRHYGITALRNYGITKWGAGWTGILARGKLRRITGIPVKPALPAITELRHYEAGALAGPAFLAVASCCGITALRHYEAGAPAGPAFLPVASCCGLPVSR